MSESKRVGMTANNSSEISLTKGRVCTFDICEAKCRMCRHDPAPLTLAFMRRPESAVGEALVLQEFCVEAIVERYNDCPYFEAA